MQSHKLGVTLILWESTWCPEPAMPAKHVCFGQLHCIRGNCATVGIIFRCFVYVCKFVFARRHLRMYL